MNLKSINESFGGLVGEKTVLFDNVFPGDFLEVQAAEAFHQVSDGQTHLLHAEKISHGHSLILDRVEINSQSEGNSALVRAGVALANRLARVINLARDAALGEHAF